jgi:hypothetical protein
MRRRSACISILAAVLAVSSLAACGGSEAEPSGAGTTTDDGETGDLPPPGLRCRGGPTRPLELETVIDVSRPHGVRLYSDPACQPDPTVVSQAANVLLYGPEETHLKLLNVDCVIYPEQDKAVEQLSRLQAAMNELQAEAEKTS